MEIQKKTDEENKKIPAGTRLLSEEERLETLEDLKQSRKEVNNGLEKLPVVSRTIMTEKHRKDLLDKLTRIDKAIDTFNKPIVYI